MKHRHDWHTCVLFVTVWLMGWAAAALYFHAAEGAHSAGDLAISAVGLCAAVLVGAFLSAIGSRNQLGREVASDGRDDENHQPKKDERDTPLGGVLARDADAE